MEVRVWVQVQMSMQYEPNYMEWGIPQEMAMDEAILKIIQEWNDIQLRKLPKYAN